MSVLRARKLTMLPFVSIIPLGLLISYVSSSVVAVSLICVVTFAHMAWKTNLMTITNDIYPTRAVGSIAGIVGLVSGIGGAIFTNLTGQVVERFSYESIFIIMAFLHPLALAIVMSLVQVPIALQAQGQPGA